MIPIKKATWKTKKYEQECWFEEILNFRHIAQLFQWTIKSAKLIKNYMSHNIIIFVIRLSDMPIILN
mgnify:CR=1 FL=1